MDARSMPEPRRIREILVATDFSDNARIAANWGTGLARRAGARVTFVHALRVPARTGSIALTAQEELRASLDAMEATARRRGVEVTSLHREGPAWEVVVEVAREISADLVVVGARGHTAYGRLLLGSNADRIVRSAPMPVLTVHPNDDLEGGVIETILVPTDFSDDDDVLSTAFGLASGGERAPRLILLHAWEPFANYDFGLGGPVVYDQLDETEAQARALLEARADPFRRRGIEVQTVVRQGYPALVIEKEAEALGADLVALSTHGRAGLQHLLLGSVAERVLHHAGCPVLTLRRTAASVARAATRSASRSTVG